jgi:hypothetical protein
VLKRTGEVAYVLLFPQGAQLHPVFHVSKLKKKHLGAKAIPNLELPLIDSGEHQSSTCRNSGQTG